jgi:hypothetical protein
LCMCVCGDRGGDDKMSSFLHSSPA